MYSYINNDRQSPKTNKIVPVPETLDYSTFSDSGERKYLDSN